MLGTGSDNTVPLVPVKPKQGHVCGVGGVCGKQDAVRVIHLKKCRQLFPAVALGIRRVKACAPRVHRNAGKVLGKNLCEARSLGPGCGRVVEIHGHMPLLYA